jgi:hypothetical protein
MCASGYGSPENRADIRGMTAGAGQEVGGMNGVLRVGQLL